MSFDKTLRVDDRFGQRREGESTSAWADRESAWKGTPSQQSVDAAEKERFEFSSKQHYAKVQAAKDAEAAKREQARQAELAEARAHHEAKTKRDEEDRLISSYRANKNRVPGKV